MQRNLVIALVVLGLGCRDSLVDPELQAPQQLLFLSAPVAADPTFGAWGNLDKDIYRMNSDGTGLENLTRLPAAYGALALSPDGRKVAFYSDRDSCYRIWTMNVDGTDLRALTTGAFSDVRCNYAPRWSPDGSLIAFTTSREGRFSVYVMNADGSNPRNISSPVDVSTGGTWPVGWTPDGRLVFERYHDGSIEMYIVNLLANRRDRWGQLGDHSPVWSPDGSKVAFIRAVDGRSSLFVSDGSGVRRLTDHAGDDLIVGGVLDNQPSPWSPDGTRIAFLNSIDFKTAVDVVRVDGSGHRRLTNHVAGAVSIDGWSADGRITFSSWESGTSDIYLIKPDGSGRVNLTANSTTTHDRYALWLPRR